ncbi:MAG: MBL fold metallo-hydrolase [Oscillospiraceae bacterium]|nr:MBL fold metallo-hydrolase [Oscillospiraceae bacterium]
MKLRILCDNNTYIDQYFLGEPAFSCYIEAEDARVLLDVGYSDVFLRNAEKMGIDLSTLTHVVLSHGHNDHTGGLTPFIEEKIAPPAKLIAHEDCFVGKYYGEEYIGAPYDVEQILYLADCQLTAEPVAITENLWYLGEIPRKLDFEPRTVIGKRERMGAWEEDDLLDDTALAYRTEKGLFIITGCAHSGICNIIEHAKIVCGDDRIIGVLGGFHLFEDDARAAATAEYFARHHIPDLYPCHCVSLKVKHRFMETLNIHEVGVGMELEI